MEDSNVRRGPHSPAHRGSARRFCVKGIKQEGYLLKGQAHRELSWKPFEQSMPDSGET